MNKVFKSIIFTIMFLISMAIIVEQPARSKERNKIVFDANNKSEHDRLIVEEYWEYLHRDLINMSMNSMIIKAEESGHDIMSTEPEIITEQGLKLMEQYRDSVSKDNY